MSRFLVFFLASVLWLSNSAQAADQTVDQLPTEPKQEQEMPPPLSAEDQQEVDLGTNIAARLLGALPLLDNPRTQNYVNAIGRWVSLHSERPDLPWRFAVLGSKDIVSFSAPGGYVFITAGLLGRTSTEAELAGVLAHEIAHVTKKHQLMAIQKIAPLAAQQAQTGIELYGKGLGWDEEFEADAMAVVITTRSGYDPYGLPVVLQLLDSIAPTQAEIRLFTATLPPLDKRIDRLEQQMSDKFEPYKSLPVLGSRFTRFIASQSGD